MKDRTGASLAPDEQIAAFLAKYDPAIAALACDARSRLRRQLPGATELVYDNYNALVFGFAPSDKPSHAFLSIALYPRWVTLFFLYGARLPDPGNLLQGAGKQVRGIRLSNADDLEAPAIQSLIAHAIAQAPAPIPTHGSGPTIVQSVSARQRPRR